MRDKLCIIIFFFVTNKDVFIYMIWLIRCMPWMCNEKRMISNELAMKIIKLVKINLNYTIICLFSSLFHCKKIWSECCLLRQICNTIIMQVMKPIVIFILISIIRNVLKSVCTEIGLKWHFFQVRWTMLPWICLETKSKKMWKYVEKNVKLVHVLLKLNHYKILQKIIAVYLHLPSMIFSISKKFTVTHNHRSVETNRTKMYRSRL